MGRVPCESPRENFDLQTPKKKVIKIKTDSDSERPTAPKNGPIEDVTPLEDPQGEMNATAV